MEKSLNNKQVGEVDKKINLLGFEFDRIRYDELLGQIERFINQRTLHKLIFLNPYLVLEARRYPEYGEYVRNCDIVTADGIGIVLAAKRFYGIEFPERVTGSDIMAKLAKKSAEKDWKVYFLGSKPGVAEKAYSKLKQLYPEFNVVGIQHGYYSKDKEDQVVERIKEKQPDILIVCLGAHKQELFIKRYQEKIGVPVAFGNGAAFDFLAGEFKRAPVWLQKIGLEWAFRLLQEPRRLWKRYLVGNTVFLWLVLKEILKGRQKTA